MSFTTVHILASILRLGNRNNLRRETRARGVIPGEAPVRRQTDFSVCRRGVRCPDNKQKKTPPPKSKSKGRLPVHVPTQTSQRTGSPT
ncbi:hypothetical protein ZHAS_00015427 [Anopheles sinensis]|uniref:Uncharacterized protein n=1 Tax=Anopheles sinensis TaxID=74873 RepID=A0A084WB82_ANOSI|nr:hypothetical protein ZHAS_00015427 [Anopheles sinensis]